MKQSGSRILGCGAKMQPSVGPREDGREGVSVKRNMEAESLDNQQSLFKLSYFRYHIM